PATRCAAEVTPSFMRVVLALCVGLSAMGTGCESHAEDARSASAGAVGTAAPGSATTTEPGAARGGEASHPGSAEHRATPSASGEGCRTARLAELPSSTRRQRLILLT